MRRSFLIASVIVAAATAGLMLTGQADRRDHPEAARSAGARTLLVFRGSEPSPSTSPTSLRVQLVSGSLSADAAVVLTDENCAPDALGVSHCLNRLRLPGGRGAGGPPSADMMDIPCLESGESVRLVDAA